MKNDMGGGAMKQRIVPACADMKSFEKFLESPYEIGIILEVHISMIKHIMRLANQHGKKIMFHMDLINGIHNNEYGTEYICQEFKPFGLISTKGSVIQKAKQNGVLAIQRMFLIDSHGLKKTLALIEKVNPDYVEVLPGILPRMIRSLKETIAVPLLAGGLIRSPDDVEKALASGATAVTTSDRTLWKYYENVLI